MFALEPPYLPPLRMTQQTRSLPLEILLSIRQSWNIFHSLPENVLIRTIEQLDFPARACLALTCKEIARITIEHGLLNTPMSADEVTYMMDQFFILCDIDLEDLKFCTECGLYRSRKAAFWRHRALTDSNKIGGRTGCRWRKALSRWSIDILIRCWLSREPALVRHAGFNSRVCPECVLNQHSAGMLPGTT